MRRLLFIPLLAIALGACQSATGAPPVAFAPSEPLERYNPTPTEQVMLVNAFDRTLRDPDSARHTNTMAHRSRDGTIYYCGLVNARNGFGGYGGPMPYFAVGTRAGVRLVAFGEDDREADRALRFCQQNGFPSPYR